jgi:hypothetical protein
MSAMSEKAFTLFKLSRYGGVMALPKGTDLPRRTLRRYGIELKTKTVKNTLWVKPIPVWFYGFA